MAARSDSAPWWRFAGAIAAVVVCAVGQWYVRDAPWGWQGTAAFIGGALAAAWFLGRPHPIASLDPSPATVPRRAARIIGPLVAVAGAALFVYTVVRLRLNWVANFDTDVPLMIVGIAVWSLGLLVCDRGWPERQPGVPWQRWEMILFLAVVALGFVVRFYRYDYFPPPEGVYAVEEPQSGQAAYLIIHAGSRPWEFVGDRWMAVPFFRVLGESLTALRLPFTIVSALTLIPFYLMMRLLVSRPAALFALALFAVSRWHLLFARSAHNIFPTTLIVVVVLYLCVRAHRRGGLALYPWIGFLCGYTLYTYAGYRATPMFAALFLGVSFLLHIVAWRRAVLPQPVSEARRRVAVQAIGLGIAAIAFVGPLLVLLPRLWSENPGYFFEAANRSLINQGYYTSDLRVFIPRMIERAKGTARLFNHVGDSAGTFNLPGEPMLDPITGTIFMVSLAYCVVWGLYRWQGFFAFGFVFLLLGGSVFVGNFDPRRLQGIIPFMFATIAFGADRLYSFWVDRLGRRSGVWLVLPALGLCGAAAWHTYDRYFVRMIQQVPVRQAFHGRYTVAAAYLHRLPADSFLVFVSDVPFFFIPSDYQWMRGDRIPGRWTGDLLPILRGQLPATDRDVHVLIQDPFEHAEVARLLKARYPSAECANATDPDAPMFEMTACRLPRGVAADFRDGLRARYYRGEQPEPFLERVEPAISFALTPDACHFPVVLGKPPCRVEWEGILQVPTTGVYEFSAEGRQADLRVTVDGQPLRPSLPLEAGAHAVQAAAQYRPVHDHDFDCGARLRWRKPGAKEWELVPFASFGSGAIANSE